VNVYQKKFFDELVRLGVDPALIEIVGAVSGPFGTKKGTTCWVRYNGRGACHGTAVELARRFKNG
jgi:hypothetical protein